MAARPHAAALLTAAGETGPMSGFSIELLDEGYRAVDPARASSPLRREARAGGDMLA